MTPRERELFLDLALDKPRGPKVMRLAGRSGVGRGWYLPGGGRHFKSSYEPGGGWPIRRDGTLGPHIPGNVRGVVYQDDMGRFRIKRPHIKVKVPKVVRRAVRAGARGVARGGKFAVKAAIKTATLPVTATLKAMNAIRKKLFLAFFGKLQNRRAQYIAYARRGTFTANAAEKREAHLWTLHYIKSRGTLGKLMRATLGGHAVGEAVTAALVTASLPVLISWLKKQLKVAEKEGAPSDPSAAAPEDNAGQGTAETVEENAESSGIDDGDPFDV